MQASARNLKGKNLFRRDTPLYLTILLVIVSGVVVYSIFPHPGEGKKITIVPEAQLCIPEMNIVRSNDYQLTHRILLAETKNENPKLSAVKESINSYISSSKTSLGVNNVSVYYRNMNTGGWFVINGGDAYNPASLMKVSYLISILKEAENNPAKLNQRIFFERHFAEGNNPNIKDFSLKENSYYTIKQLLEYMIIYSDNDATSLIVENSNPAVYKKLFTDLEIPPPGTTAEYFINIQDYCKFFRVLYSSAYLRDEYSEFALELLTKSTYSNGILKGLHQGFPVAHKFGERIIKNIQQLHEVGIFYCDQQPYMLGVMSSGNDLRQLSTVLSEISAVIYRENKKVN